MRYFELREQLVGDLLLLVAAFLQHLPQNLARAVCRRPCRYRLSRGRVWSSPRLLHSESRMHRPPPRLWRPGATAPSARCGPVARTPDPRGRIRPFVVCRRDGDVIATRLRDRAADACGRGAGAAGSSSALKSMPRSPPRSSAARAQERCSSTLLAATRRHRSHRGRAGNSSSTGAERLARPRHLYRNRSILAQLGLEITRFEQYFVVVATRQQLGHVRLETGFILRFCVHLEQLDAHVGSVRIVVQRTQ